MFPPETSFDQAARYILRQGSPELLLYLCGLDREHIRFVRWHDTVAMYPGTKQRICDAVADLEDTRQLTERYACLVEFQAEPDPNMTDRLMVAGGLFRSSNKPDTNVGDRYNLAFLVVNLTGRGKSGREMKLGEMEVKMIPREWNLQDVDAAEELAAIEQGQAPPEWLTFIPLMQNAGDADIISRWRAIADKETDMRKRQTLSLAIVFASAREWQESWTKATEDFIVLESPLVRKWKDEAERKGRSEGRSEGKREGLREGEREGKAKVLIRQLKLRFGNVPEDLVTAIEICEDLALLENWADQVVLAKSLQEFRDQTKIA